jgi:hypothetical protein
MRIIVAGGRDFDDYESLAQKCADMIKYIYENPSLFGWIFHKDIEFVLGGANGADSLGLKFAKENLYEYKVMNADWDTYGKSAGYIRNEQMAKYAIEDNNAILLAFWDGVSKGTSHMIELAKKHGLIVWLVRY